VTTVAAVSIDHRPLPPQAHLGQDNFLARVVAEFASIGSRRAAYGDACTHRYAVVAWRCDRDHDTARGPGGPCSVAALSHRQRPGRCAAADGVINQSDGSRAVHPNNAPYAHESPGPSTRCGYRGSRTSPGRLRRRDGRAEAQAARGGLVEIRDHMVEPVGVLEPALLAEMPLPLDQFGPVRDAVDAEPVAAPAVRVPVRTLVRVALVAVNLPRDRRGDAVRQLADLDEVAHVATDALLAVDDHDKPQLTVHRVLLPLNLPPDLAPLVEVPLTGVDHALLAGDVPVAFLAVRIDTQLIVPVLICSAVTLRIAMLVDLLLPSQPAIGAVLPSPRPALRSAASPPLDAVAPPAPESSESVDYERTVTVEHGL